MLYEVKKINNVVAGLLLGTCVTLMPLTTQAEEVAQDRTGSFTLSARVGNLFGSAETDGIANIGPVGFTPPGIIPGSDIEVDDSFVLTFIPSYYVTDHIAIDMFIATPAFMGISATGLESFGVSNVGKIEFIVPAVYITAYPAPADWKFQPSLSVGFGTMVKTRSDKISGELEAALGAGSTLDIPRDKFIPTARLGLDYAVSERWSLGVHATMFWGNVTSTITPTAIIPLGPNLSAPLGPIVTDIKINVLVVQSGITYRF